MEIVPIGIHRFEVHSLIHPFHVNRDQEEKDQQKETYEPVTVHVPGQKSQLCQDTMLCSPKPSSHYMVNMEYASVQGLTIRQLKRSTTHSDIHATLRRGRTQNMLTQNCHGHVQMDHNKFKVMIIITHNTG
jgi:hypothetical protein